MPKNAKEKIARKIESTINEIPKFLVGWGHRGVMVKVMDCEIVVGEFQLQSRYYVYFRVNTLGKGIIPFVFSSKLWVK